MGWLFFCLCHLMWISESFIQGLPRSTHIFRVSRNSEHCSDYKCSSLTFPLLYKPSFLIECIGNVSNVISLLFSFMTSSCAQVISKVFILLQNVLVPRVFLRISVSLCKAVFTWKENSLHDVSYTCTSWNFVDLVFWFQIS